MGLNVKKIKEIFKGKKALNFGRMLNRRGVVGLVTILLMLLVLAEAGVFYFANHWKENLAQPQFGDQTAYAYNSPNNEILSKRTMNSKTFDLGEGKFKTVNYLGPVHYQDEQGAWQEINTDIENQSNDADFDNQNKKNIFQTHFKGTSTGNFLRFKMGNSWIKYKLENDPSGLGNVNNVNAAVSANTVTYPNVYEGVDLKYTIFPANLLEEYIINSSSAAAKITELKQKFLLREATYQVQQDGSIQFYDSKNNPVWFIPKPVMYELNNPGKINYGLHYEITQAGVNYFISKVLDQEGKDWLKDPDRIYPVVIDASAGPNSPGTMADDATVGTAAWTNPDNAKVSDNVYTTVGAGDTGISHYLKATNFGFSIPSGATIGGILVEIERKGDLSDASNNIQDSNLRIVKSDGTIGTTNKADIGTNWPTSDTYASYGSSTYL